MTQPLPYTLDIGEMIGGRRGVVDASLPGVTVVIVDAFASLMWAIAAALLTAVVLAVLRVVRREPLRQAAMGLLGLVGAAALARFTGEAKNYFLPGILLNAAYAIVAYGVALAYGDHPERPFVPLELTADWTFLRFHFGHRGRRGNYSATELDEWAERVRDLRERVEVFAYFNNDWEAFAIHNALGLKERLQRFGGSDRA